MVPDDIPRDMDVRNRFLVRVSTGSHMNVELQDAGVSVLA
jgi:hypothetical protein